MFLAVAEPIVVPAIEETALSLEAVLSLEISISRNFTERWRQRLLFFFDFDFSPQSFDYVNLVPIKQNVCSNGPT